MQIQIPYQSKFPTIFSKPAQTNYLVASEYQLFPMEIVEFQFIFWREILKSFRSRESPTVETIPHLEIIKVIPRGTYFQYTETFLKHLNFVLQLYFIL